MTSPNQTPDALRAIINECLDPLPFSGEDDLHPLVKESKCERLLTAIAPFLAPPLTPDASTTGKGENITQQGIDTFIATHKDKPAAPTKQGAEGRTPRTDEVAFNMYDAVAAEDSCQMVVERGFARQLETELASARAELAEAKEALRLTKTELEGTLLSIKTQHEQIDMPLTRAIVDAAKANGIEFVGRSPKQIVDALRAQVKEARKDGESLKARVKELEAR